MAKRKIPVSNNQVNETKLINSLNSNLLKKEDENTNSIKEESPAEEKTLYTIMKEEREEALAKTEPATDTPQDELPGPYAANACNCGPEIVEDNASNFDKVESDRQRELKYNAHADKIGYADASPSPAWTNAMVFKDLSPDAMEKLKDIIVPEAESILKRFDKLKNTLKDNEDCRKTVNSEIGSSATLTDYGKKMLDVGKKAGRIVTGKDTEYEMVDHPSHYNQYDIEVIDMIIRIWGPEAAALWCDITAFKYRMRMGTKPGNSIEQDIKKEQWYLNKSKEIRENLIK